jgi:Mn-containing catalase
METLKGKPAKEDYIHEAMTHPEFLVRTGGGVAVTNCQGVPWSGAYVNANGDLTVDLRSDIAAESRAKIVYEYLMQFTDDQHVKESLTFLMTREIAHFQMFEAALDTIKPNFPPGVLQGDPRYTSQFFNMSTDGHQDARGPWNQGQSPELHEQWKFIEDPEKHVRETKGLRQEDSVGKSDIDEANRKGKELGQQRSKEINDASSTGWSRYE